jgi:UDP-glucose 4-epimerase
MSSAHAHGRRALVLGGSGFLGSHVADQLSEAGYGVLLFDRVASPWKRPEQQMIVGDLLDSTRLGQAVAGADVVYNFAAIADLNRAMTLPAETARVNVLGNALVLEACREHRVRRFVYASTVYVHSREGGFYRCSKHAAEQYIQEFHRAFELDYTILRYGSLYGPRADASNGLFRIVSHALETGVLRYEGSADALREYIHVEDAARASVAALGEEFRNQSVVLTGHEPMRVLDLMHMLQEMLGLPDSVEFVETSQPGHYVRTPYAYSPGVGRKYTPPLHVDLGQGLLQLIEDVAQRRLEKGSSTARAALLPHGPA